MYWKHPEKALQQCHRVLKPGGRMLVTLGYNSDPGNTHRKLNASKSHHLVAYTTQEATELFEAAGFEVSTGHSYDLGPVTQGKLFLLRMRTI